MKVLPFCTPVRRPGTGVSVLEHETQQNKIGHAMSDKTGGISSSSADPANTGLSQSSKVQMKPPKQPLSNFALFMKQQEGTLKKKGLSDEESKVKAMEMWHNTTPAVKDKYQALYTRNKKKYDADLIKYNEQIKKRKLAILKGGRLNFKSDKICDYFQVLKYHRKKNLLRPISYQIILTLGLLQILKEVSVSKVQLVGYPISTLTCQESVEVQVT